MEKLNRLLKYILFLTLIVFIAAISIQKIRNFDIWWHLKTGEYILSNHFIPKFDIFSYTVPTHRWVNHQWLADVFFFFVFNRFGVNGLILLKTMVLAATFAILFAIAYRRKLYILSVAALLLAVLASSHRFIIRPFIFNFFFTAIYFYILHSYKYKNKKLIYLLPICQIFWTNLHGGSLIGLILIFFYLIGEALAWKLKLPFQWNEEFTIKDKKYFTLLGVAIVTVLASIINPNGLTGVFYPFLTLTELNQSGYQQVVMKFVAELRPPFTIYSLFKIHPYPYFKLLLIVSLAALILNFKRLRITHLLIYVIFLIFSLKANRNIPAFAILAIPMTVFNIEDILSRKQFYPLRKRLREPLKLALQVLLIACLIVLISKSTAPEYLFRDKIIRSFGLGTLDLKYPKGAVDFIQKNDIPRNIFNTYESGGYLIWRLFPETKVFIDGRTEVYGPNFYGRYVSLFSGPEQFNKVAEQFDINYILLTRIYSATNPFLTYIYKHESWKLVYFDEISAVFVKDSPINKGIIKKYSNISNLLIAATPYKPTKGIFPFTLFKQAEFLRAIGLYDQAIAEFQKALKAESETQLIHNNIGISYYEKGAYLKAEDEFLTAIKLKPNYAEAHNNLGSVYARLDMPDKAIVEFEKAIRIDPSYTNACLNLAMTYAKIKQNKKAIQQYKKLLRLNPDSIEAHSRLGILLYEQGRPRQAMKEYKTILGLEPNSALAHNNLGVIYNALGRKDEAVKEWKETLRLNPEHKEAKSNLEEALKSPALEKETNIEQ